MSVLIKGMDMPTSCSLCKFKTVVGLDKEKCLVSGVEFCSWDTGWGDKQRRHESCPLVLVLPHGRLIDADALMELIKAHDYPLRAHFNSTDNGMFTIGIQQAVDELPTIIPAEEEMK